MTIREFPSYHYKTDKSAPAHNSFEITPDDNNDLPVYTRGIYVGGRGDIRVEMAEEGGVITYHKLKAGSIYPFVVKRVYLTGTTATNLRGLW